MSGTLIRDQMFVIQYNPSTQAPQVGEEGVLIANGKVGLLSSFGDLIDVSRSFITSELKYLQGTYQSNTLEVFYVNHVTFFSNVIEESTYTLNLQSLDLGTAIFTGTHIVVNNNTTDQVNVTYDLYTPRNLPFCTMQSFSLTPTNCSSIPFFHQVYCKENICDVEFNNNTIYNQYINANSGLHILLGKGRTVEGTQVVFASCYLFELASTNIEPLGFNVYRHDLRKCYNMFRLKNLIPGQTYKVHILTAMMTDFDFENPIEEVKRIVLTVGNRDLSAAVIAAKVRSDHVEHWNKLWETHIRILPKNIASASETSQITNYNLLINVALYNLYSSAREQVNLDINPLNISLIDREGYALYDGDIWVTPLLVMLKPDMARAVVDFRYKTISTAQQISAGYGYKGAKFPYINDVLGYKNALYWDATNPMHIFNNALVAINAWNYYRVSRDKEWLISKGYPILRQIADFFLSIITINPDTSYHINDVVGIAGVESSDQAFTNNVARLAIKYAIEACYELQFVVKEDWLRAVSEVPLHYYSGANYDVLKFDSSSTTTSTQYSIMEPFFVLVPYLSNLYFCGDCHYGSQPRTLHSIVRNLEFYPAATWIKPEFQTHPYNNALYGILQGISAQIQSSYLSTFQTSLDAYIANNVVGIWKHMRTIGTQVPQSLIKNSLVTNAAFLMMLLQGMADFTVNGGVAETRFYYEEFRLRASVTSSMPKSWFSLEIKNVGQDKKYTFSVLNSTTYT